MENYKKTLTLLIILFGAVASTIYVTHTFNSFGVFIFDFSLIFLIIFIVLILAKEEIIYVWFKFASIFLPITIFFVIISPTVNGSLIGLDKKLTTFFLATIFLVISILI